MCYLNKCIVPNQDFYMQKVSQTLFLRNNFLDTLMWCGWQNYLHIFKQNIQRRHRFVQSFWNLFNQRRRRGEAAFVLNIPWDGKLCFRVNSMKSYIGGQFCSTGSKKRKQTFNTFENVKKKNSQLTPPPLMTITCSLCIGVHIT